MSRPKARRVTLTDIKAGRATPAERAQFTAIMRRFSEQLGAVMTDYRAHEAEALRLYELLSDADLNDVRPGSRAHETILANPPSVGAVAVLILLAEDKLEGRLAAERSQAASDAAEKRHAVTQACLEAAKTEYESSAELRGMRVKAAAAVLAERHPPIAAETYRKKLIAWRKKAGTARRR